MNGKQLKNSILQWAIQGKLVPQDPNDEPASILLERIREEKVRLVKEGKIKKDKNESIIFRGDDNSHYEKFLATGEVKCIDDEIPFEIPEGWEWCRLGFLSEIIGGYAFESSSLKASSGERVIRISDINEAGFVNNKIVRYNGTPISETYRIKELDILMAMTGGTVGKSLYVKTLPEDSLLLNQRVAIIRNRFIYSDYLDLVIKAPHIRDVINSRKNSTNDNISMTDIYNFLIPIPAVQHQVVIVKAFSDILPLINRYGVAQFELDRLNTNIKATIQKSILQEAIQGKLVPQDPNDEPASVLLERIREEKQRLLKEGKLKKKDITNSVIFKGEDNKYYEQIGKEVIDISEDIPFEIPESWSWIRLSNICSICTGATFKKEDATQNQSGVRILRGGNILPFRIYIKDDDIFIPRDAVKDNILLRQNDIVTPAVTSLENIGKMARIKSDMLTTTVGGFVFILRPYLNDDILSEYLLSAMSAPATVEFMRSITNKSGQAFYNIGKERLSTTLLPVPPHVEQMRIIENIQYLFSKLS